MPRPTKKAKVKNAKGPVAEQTNGAPPEVAPVSAAVADAPPSQELQPPTAPVETVESADSYDTPALATRADLSGKQPASQLSTRQTPVAEQKAAGRPANRKNDGRQSDEKDR